MKTLSVIGARPQFIKAAVVSKALRACSQEILLHTGQHYDDNMSRIFFDELAIPKPDINLGVGSGSHASQTAQMLTGIETVILQEKPDWVLIYGDTNSTLAGALAAVKLQVRVAHVEAGLRSYNRAMPEEINRLVCDQLSSALFCPSQQAVSNLKKENILQGIYDVGDVMYDAIIQNLDNAKQHSHILQDLHLTKDSYALATIHRAANTDDPQRLKAILSAFGQSGIEILFPIHPRTRKIITELGISLPTNLKCIAPLGYLDMLQLEANANAILTDSGGIQKEAYWLGIRCITLREETEWVETVKVGWNKLVGTDTAAIISSIQNWNPNSNRPPIYGDGHASEQISHILNSL